jgi:hypothetical protein
LAETCDEILILSQGKWDKKVQRTDFDLLGAEMKSITIGNRVDRLNLR